MIWIPPCHGLLRAVWSARGGVEVGTEWDAFFVAFADPREAVSAAAAGQRALGSHVSLGGREVRARMGVHTGSPRVRDGEYWGIDVHYAARLCAPAHGGQVLVSDSTAALVDADFEDLGRHALKDFPSPRTIFHLRIDGRGSELFPAPRTLRPGQTNLGVLRCGEIRSELLTSGHGWDTLSSGVNRSPVSGVGGATAGKRCSRTQSERSLVGNMTRVCGGAMAAGAGGMSTAATTVGGNGPLSAARVGDRFALALISLTLDQMDATELLGGRR